MGNHSPGPVDDKKQLFEFRKGSLPGELVPASLQVMKFSSQHLTVDGANSFVDWSGFSKAIKEYKGSDLALDRYEHTSINQQEQTVDTMVQSIVSYFADAFSASYEEKVLKAIITATFCNLKQKKSEGDFLSFGKTGGSNNQAFQYRLVFAVPMENSPSYFYALVTTIKVTADITEESSWWGLSSSTTKNFGVDIDAMELVVQKGYEYKNW